MPRRVEKQQRELLRRRQHGALPGRPGARARIVAEAAVILQDGIDIAVARDEPRVEQPAAMHRVPGTQGRIDGIGVLRRARRQRVVTHPAVHPLAQRLRERAHRAHRLAKRPNHRLLAPRASTRLARPRSHFLTRRLTEPGSRRARGVLKIHSDAI